MSRQKTKTFDQKCWDLAEHFLSTVQGATEADKETLAYDIQSVCEDACQDITGRSHGSLQ